MDLVQWIAIAVMICLMIGFSLLLFWPMMKAMHEEMVLMMNYVGSGSSMRKYFVNETKAQILDKLRMKNIYDVLYYQLNEENPEDITITFLGNPKMSSIPTGEQPALFHLEFQEMPAGTYIKLSSHWSVELTSSYYHPYIASFMVKKLGAEVVRIDDTSCGNMK